MSKAIYPYKFIPVPQEKVWGGLRLASKCGKPFERNMLIGASWEISGFENDSSVIAEGYLEENTLFDVIETYMDEIVGEDNYKHFGNEFPLLIKLLDIEDRLSVQVHPDDETAFDRHNSYGKNEAWYIMEASPDSIIYMGFNKDISPSEFFERCQNGTLEEVLNKYHPRKGDFFFIESGTIHSAGGGLLIAEVQQLSDVTYRIYDWGRENNPSTAREMHINEAFDCINYQKYDPVRYFVPAKNNEKDTGDGSQVSRVLVRNKYFNITELTVSSPLHIYTDKYDSFILYFGLEGNSQLVPAKGGNATSLNQYEWVMVPASYTDFFITPIDGISKVLEVHIAKTEDKDPYIEDGDVKIQEKENGK